ncbi:hypothetical protein GN156_03950 [bacterium LRH843]|nr:hypothetical protein [bacterium LRH843]
MEINIIFLMLLFVIFYFTLKWAIRNGIDESKIGKYLMEKHRIINEEPPIQKEIEKTYEEIKHKY